MLFKNLFIYYTWKNTRRQDKSNKFEIIAPTWNGEFEMNGWFVFSVRYSRLYRACHENYETLSTNPPINVYINRINSRLVFKRKDRYKLELQTSETMKLFGSTKKLIDKTKNGENVPTVEVFEVFLVQCNLVDN